MAEYRLYCFAQSGNAYKAALMLNLCGADWEARFVDFFNGETRTSEFRQINEMGEVPVLEHRGQAAQPVGRDPRLPGRPPRPLRLAERGRAARDPALAAVGQPQVHELHRHAALPAPLHEDRRDAGHRVPARPREERARRPRRSSGRAANSCSARARRSPTSRSAATCTSPTSSASTGPIIPRSAPGSSASGRCRAGSTPTS